MVALNNHQVVPKGDVIDLSTVNNAASVCSLIKNYPYEAIQKSCKVLSKFGITYFLYVDRYFDGSQIELCSNPEWHLDFFKRGFFHLSEFDQSEVEYNDGNFLWKSLYDEKIYAEMRNNYNIDHGITLVRKGFSSTEFFYFATEKGNEEIINVYLNKLHELVLFAHLFKSEYSKLIENSKETRIKMPGKHSSSSLNLLNIHDMNMTECYLNITNRYYFGSINEKNYLTATEMKIATLFCKGTSVKKISYQLNISKRTVESHLQKIREKLKCGTSLELLKNYKDLFEIF